MPKLSEAAVAKLLATPLYQRVASEVHQLARGQVWCHRCGHTEKVDSAHCLRHGWPVHCGQTMSIDAPSEIKA